MTTGTAVVRGQEAQAYLDRVGTALADLPEEERADLLDELGGHLDELAAEGTSSLESRLGTPEAYAAELRASAGLPPPRARGRAVARLVAGIEEWLRRPVVVSVREFLVAAAPAWWVLRAWLLVSVLALGNQPSWARPVFFVPRVVTGEIGGVLLLAAVVASVQLGRRSTLLTRRSARSWVVALNVAAALAVLPVMSSLSDASDRMANSAVYEEPQFVERVPAEGVYANGTQVWNVYAYDADGTMLHDVRLYDQDGKPLALGLAFDSTKKQTLDASGRRVDNAYPYRYVDATTGDVADPEAGPPISAPPLLGVPTETPTPSATPSATPSPSPTGGKR